jgi:hypothetical protein
MTRQVWGKLIVLCLLSYSACASDQRSLLPDLLFVIDPAFPATEKPLLAAGIQVDEAGQILAMKIPGSGIMLRKGSGGSTLVANGLDGRPMIVNPPGGNPGGWNSLVLDPEAADRIAARRFQQFAIALVERRRSYAACDIMKLYAKNGVHIHFSPRADGAILIGQNNGPGVAVEKSAERLNQWGITYYLYDGKRAWLVRNGVVTARTPSFAGGGFGPRGMRIWELLNGCAMDVAWLAVAGTAPSVGQINAESHRLRTVFPSIVPQKNLVDGDLDDGAADSPAASVAADALEGEDARFLTEPNNPLRDKLPVDQGAAVGDGLKLTAGARNAFSLVMGSAQPHANMTSSQSIRDRFFLNYMEGDLKRAIGSPMDTGQADNSTFAAVARHFPVDDPDDLHVMAPDGMHLRAMCSHGHMDCRPGHVWGAMIRVPFEWRPGMTMKVRYKSPKGDHSWAPIWMFTGQQISPGPGGDPYRGFGGPDALYRASKKNFEIDWNDNFSRSSAGVPTGYQVDFGTPNIYGVTWDVKPHAIYLANGDGWHYYPWYFHPDFETGPFDWSEGFHDLVGNWRDDGSKLIDLFVDGKIVATQYMEYPQTVYVDAVDGRKKTIAMHLIIGNQAIPRFSHDPSQAKDNDGIRDGWTIVIQEISGWYGNVADPDARRASPQNGVR